MLDQAAEAKGICLSRVADEILGREEWMMAMDAVTYLPGDSLVKLDRTATSASLETRAPFLDWRSKLRERLS
jgi:asparagine synthase (glutamine-hydrolysing)